MSGATTVAYLARRAAQKEKVRILYRCALKDILNWAVHRHLFYQDVVYLHVFRVNFIVEIARKPNYDGGSMQDLRFLGIGF
ncbi:hypothetical protein GOBAR_AA08428 [Gossypium barbadense]|uniref:NADH dehydrogenase [ubiquinone] 1 beta subcomplex subunit 9 n=1 Tax=Gossypium barbadense TaxID=3634 RepID=A0A2P5Y9D4_GOSBA|nr:hypothetical protein GOBAR_AA08428 [Gossypium barbadense]